MQAPSGNSTPVYEFGPFRLNTRRRLLESESGTAPLTAKVFDTLAFLIEHQQRTVSKDELLHHVWPDSVVEEGNLTRNISTLRRILGDSPEAHRYILTVPGEGYRFVAPVRSLPEEVATPSAGQDAQAHEVTASELQVEQSPVGRGTIHDSTRIVPAHDPHGRGGPFSMVATILAVAFIVATSVAVWMGQPGFARTDQPVQSLAVLPLENLSADPEQEYFADGITDAIIGRLSAARDLRVISRTSVMQFKNTRQTVPEIAEALDVDALVVGSVLRSGSRVRISVQLIDARSAETNLWSEIFETELGDVLLLQMNVAESIARSIELRRTARETRRVTGSRPVTPEVYEHYLRGRYALTRPQRAAVPEAMAHFEAALALDPAFAPAYTGLSRAYRELGTIFRGGSPQAEMLPKSVGAAQQALRLDPTLAEAHVMIAAARQREWQWQEADTAFRHALDLEPNNAQAHIGLAHLLVAQGRIDDGVQLARKARALDPLSAEMAANVGWTFYFARRYDEAIRECQASLDLQKDNHSGLWFLGISLNQAGRFDEAIQILERAAAISDRSPGLLGSLTNTYARAGRRDDALRTLNELERRRQTGYVPSAPFVHAYAGLGDLDQAFTWLERAHQETSNLIWQLKVAPTMDPLRADPRFSALLRRVWLE
ncbi:MAG: winged helix-turn-helix domain-containing protein [Acidobacteria bacterium]|nr:winged helix-turn-helix domain-containing protein [Acidobacteriota bacterium]